jgi:hypothetical protein
VIFTVTLCAILILASASGTIISAVAPNTGRVYLSQRRAANVMEENRNFSAILPASRVKPR